MTVRNARRGSRTSAAAGVVLLVSVAAVGGLSLDLTTRAKA